MVMAGRWFEFRGRRLRVIFVCSVGVQALWITCTMMLHIGLMQRTRRCAWAQGEQRQGGRRVGEGVADCVYEGGSGTSHGGRWG